MSEREHRKKAMEQFQQASVTAFYERTRKAIDETAGRRVPFGSNNFGGTWTYFAHAIFEIGCAELWHQEAYPSRILELLQATATKGRAQLFTFVSEKAPETRKMIAITQACGGHMIVPWDVYLKSTKTGSKRYYGKAVDYADLYGMVRAVPELLDGYRVVGGSVIDKKGKRKDAGGTGVTVTGGSGALNAVVQAKPGQADAPIVVHLVAWKAPAEATIELPAARCFGERKVAVELVTPRPYDAKAHAAAAKQAEELRGDGRRGAAQAEAFAELVERRELEAAVVEGRLRIVVAGVKPWGLVVIRLAADDG